MGEAIGQVLTFAVGVTLSPIPIIAVVLMLGTPKARANGPAFLGGWILGLSALGTIVLLVASGAEASENGAPAEGLSLVKLLLGILLLGLAARQWRGRPKGGSEPELPTWMKAVDTFGAPKAGATGVLLALNPKNLVLVVGGAAAIAQTGESAGDQAVALAVFVVVATFGPSLPVAIYFLMRERSAAILEALRARMVRDSATIMAVICLVIGAKLIGDAISGLSG